MTKKSYKKFSPTGSSLPNPLSQYMKEISEIKLLSKEEEIKLAEAIKEGDPKATQEMVRRNLKYVVTVANKYRGFGISLQDLIEEGNIGLILVAKRFDVSKNVKFITYAVWWVKQTIINSLCRAVRDRQITC